MKQPSAAVIEQALQATVNHPAALVAIYSMDQKCRWASASHKIILGYNGVDMLGKPWTKFVAPEDHAHADLAGQDALFNGESIEFSIRAATKTGERVPLKGKAWIVPDPMAKSSFLFFQATPTG